MSIGYLCPPQVYIGAIVRSLLDIPWLYSIRRSEGYYCVEKSKTEIPDEDYAGLNRRYQAGYQSINNPADRCDHTERFGHRESGRGERKGDGI